MTAIRIVCTLGTSDTAEALQRLLAAEQHDVRISKGRGSAADLRQAREAREAVVLIWCDAGRAAQYMRDWSEAIPAERLIEIARTPYWPRARAEVLDFNAWRGERGGQAWDQLQSRLDDIGARWAPPQTTPPPKRGAPLRVLITAGALSACVATAAAFMFTRETPAEAPAVQAHYEEAEESEQAPSGPSGMGGAIEAVEPPSANEFRPAPEEIAPQSDRELTLLERLLALNPWEDEPRPAHE